MTATTGADRMFPIAIDFGRFSGRSQEFGDSKRRQKSLADAWSERTGIPIDLRLCEEGVSGFQRQERRLSDDAYALAHFLKMVEQGGRVRPGDYLLLENLDRLSRDKEVRATHLLTSILVAGVKVVQLAPYELELTEDSDMFGVFRAVMELSRGHGESKRKRQMVGASYANNRAAAVTGEESYQGRLPAWVERVPEAQRAKHCPLRLIPERAKTVQYIYQLAAQGLGYSRIAKRLNAEGVPPFGDRTPRLDEDGQQERGRGGRLRWDKAGSHMGAGKWQRGYVEQILSDRRACGEWETRSGEVVPIPAAVTEEEWLAARAGRAERGQYRGRPAKNENLWAGLVTDARTGEHMLIARGKGRAGYRGPLVLINRGGNTGETASSRFTLSVFEEAVLRCLKEIRVEEVTRAEGAEGVTQLSGRLEEVRAQLAELKEELTTLKTKPRGALQAMAELEGEEAHLEEERRQAQQAAAHPLSEAWGQAKTLMDVAKTAEERLRLRSLLRRMVDSIHILIVQRSRGWDRVAAVQMRFRDSAEVRSWLIVHRSAIRPDGSRASRRPGDLGEDVWHVGTLRHPAELDMRDPAQVAALRDWMQALDLAAL